MAAISTHHDLELRWETVTGRTKDWMYITDPKSSNRADNEREKKPESGAGYEPYGKPAAATSAMHATVIRKKPLIRSELPKTDRQILPSNVSPTARFLFIEHLHRAFIEALPQTPRARLLYTVTLAAKNSCVKPATAPRLDQHVPLPASRYPGRSAASSRSSGRNCVMPR